MDFGWKKRIFLSLALYVFYFVAARTHATTEVIPRNLKFGDSGDDVVLLQKILNQDPDTRVAFGGPGSPGKETSYFAGATRNAVIRFQKKYAKEVLLPVSLISPTGFVGTLTRHKLESFFLSDNQPTAPTTIQNVSPGSQNSALQGSPQATSSNPNFENIDIFLGKLAELEKAKGLDVATIEQRANSIRQYAATSTNFRTQFEASVKKPATNPQGSSGNFLFNLGTLLRPILDQLAPQAFAITGVPFGGPITFVYPCSCPPNIFLLTIGPPSTAQLLDYVGGTEAFLSYNLPYARFLLGYYMPGSGEACWQLAAPSCIPLPAEGTVEPFVGSSPL